MQSKYRWRVAPKISDDLKLQLLYNRKIITKSRPSKSKIEAFLTPNTKKHLFDPFKLSDLKKAVGRILKAAKNKEKVGVFSDYDADGIPGAALVYQGLKKLKLKPLVYIPSRSEGYGFSQGAVDFFTKEKVTLVVAVDVGIRDFKTLKFAKRKKIDVIVCDHHEPAKNLPQAYALINPKKKKEKYPFKELSGAAVAFKLLQGLSKKDSRINNHFLRWSLDLVAISVIFDMVPLISENRIFAKLGLLILKNTKRLGLRELFKVSSLSREQIDAYVVGFILGPRINAPGRIYNPQTSFELLITKSPKKARDLAQILDAVNKERQKETEKCLLEAKKLIQKKKLHKNKVILIESDEWPEGLIGLIASKLKEEFNRPVFVFARGEKTAKGSARSIDGFHLIEALGKVKKLIVKGGGHAKAAGLELESENIERFYEKLLQWANKKIKPKDLTPILDIDAEIDFKKISWQFWNLVDSLAPFGMGNPRPLFLTKKVKVKEVRTIGREERHLSLFLEKDDQLLRAVYFNGGEHLAKIRREGYIDLVYSISVNDFSGQPKLELKIEDLRLVKN